MLNRKVKLKENSLRLEYSNTRETRATLVVAIKVKDKM